MSREEFEATTGVSRETMDRLDAYEKLLVKWNPAINLISKSTVGELWSRHFLDSAQLARFFLAGGHWADFGSGGGFPGLVLAILAAEKEPSLAFTLVESDVRKAAFLQAVSREVGVPVRILSERIERIDPLGADVVSARALAPLPQLISWLYPHLAEGGRAVLLKGAGSDGELSEALAYWRLNVQKYSSQSDPRGVILVIEGISRG